MKTSAEPIIEVIRHNEKLSSLKVIMPIWNESGEDNKIYTKIPLLGGLKTYSINENDTDIAVKEAIECFCIAAERYGNGLENELENIGWVLTLSSDNRTVLNIDSSNSMFNLVLQTGETTALDLELEKDLEFA